MSVSGFPANAVVWVSECAEPTAGHVVCDIPGISQITADGGGAGSTTLTAWQKYTAYSEPGVVWGTVDCATVSGGCFVAAATDSSPMIKQAISFG